MEGNQSWITEFILVGFQLSEDIEVLLFCIFSLFYIFNLLANGMILGLIWLDLRLHSPMYFLLSHLAIIDICYASSNLQLDGIFSCPSRSTSLAQCGMTRRFLTILSLWREWTMGITSWLSGDGLSGGFPSGMI
uniref:G-protein coupled receptors family 1 profile domain-containing protein n=1 Tax=Canis lupus familiaris TaxID=9615 RepID=A0A8P0PK63_CANLF